MLHRDCANSGREEHWGVPDEEKHNRSASKTRYAIYAAARGKTCNNQLHILRVQYKLYKATI